jgi:AraC-like DNA-binding protein
LERRTVERRAALALQRHRIFATRDAEEARIFLDSRGFLLDVPTREAAHLDIQINGAFLPGLYLGCLQYGAAVEIRTTQYYDDYRFVTLMRGSLAATIARRDISCRPGTAILISPKLGASVRAERDCAGLNIFFDGPTLRRELAALLGEPIKAPLEFAATLSLREGYGRSLARFARLAMTELDQTDSILLEPITARSFREFVTSALLLHQPHSYAEALRRLERRAAPRDVKRAIDYMRANLATPIGLSEIVAVSGVPGRTLIQHFRDFEGTSPIRYLRTARFEKTREALRRAEPEENITEIASSWGFTHMGRFSVEYRRRFGESPSETLRRRRSGPA